MRLAVHPNGWITCGNTRIRCALGKNGVSTAKREGDGTTPAGTFPLRRLYYRPDRVTPPPVTGLPCTPLRAEDGWCDDPTDPAYNMPVRLPYGGSAEHLWRDDHLYDIIVIIGFNDDPPEPGRGSAIFLHLAQPSYAATEGCVAVSLDDARYIVERLDPTSTLSVAATARPSV